MSLQRAVFPILISITGILTPVLPQTPFDVMSIRERIGQGRLDEAYQLCLHFRSTNPADMDMNRLLVETASYRGRLDQPDSLYRLEIREGRNLSSAYFGEGLVQYHRHNFQKTILFINKALELGCSSPAAMQVLVPSYERAFGSEQTRRYFTILSHRYPGNPNAWYGLALATWGMGNSSTIFEALDHALRLQPEEPRYEQARIAAEAAFAPGAETFKRLDGALAKSLTRLDFEGWCFLMVARILLHQECGEEAAARAKIAQMNLESSRLGLKRWEGWASLKLAEQSSAGGNLFGSLRWARQSYSAAMLADDQQLKFSVLSHIAECSLELGDLREALRASLEHMALGQTSGMDEETLKGLLDVGQCLVMMESPESGLFFLTSALARVTRGTANMYEIVKLRSLIGIANQKLGNQIEAAAQLNIALRILKEEKLWSQTKATILNELAHVSIARKEYKTALRLHKEQLEIGRTTHEQRIIMAAERGLGEVYLAEGRLGFSFRSFSNALSEARAAGVFEDRIESLRGLALIAIKRKNVERAIQLLREIVGLSSPQLNLRATIFTNRQHHDVELLVDLLIQKDSVREAFLVVQKYLRKRFSDPLFLDLNSSRLRISDTLKALIGNNRKELAESYRALANHSSSKFSIGDDAKEMHLRTRILRREIEAADLLDSVNRRPNQAVSSNCPTLDITSLQRGLAKGRGLLLQYLIGEDKTFLFAVTSDSIVAIRRSMNCEDFESRLVRLSPLLDVAHEDQTVWNRLLGGFDDDERDSLYLELLQPVSDLIDSSNEILIIPDDPIRNLPFELLTEPSKISYPSDPIRRMPLLRKRVHYALWLESGDIPLETLQDPTFVALKGVTSVGVSLPPDADVEMYDLASSQYIPRLPAAEEECDELSKLFRDNGTAKVYTGNLNEDFTHSTILHIAAHATWNRDVPIGSTMDFLDRQGTQHKLSVEDLAQVLHENEMIVLNGCSTARWSNEANTYGFQLAVLNQRSSSFLGTIWPVEDGISRFIMLRFYGYLKEGYPASESLRRAKIDIIRSGRSDPYAWAGFMLWGADRRYNFQDGGDLTLAPIGAVIVLISLLQLILLLSKKHLQWKRLKNIPGATKHLRR